MYKIWTVLLILVTLGALTKCIPHKPDPDFEEKCQAKFNISNEELSNFSKAYKDDSFTVDRKFKCYTKCLMDELVKRDANGKIDVESFLGLSPTRKPSEHIIRITNECKNKFEVEEDECEYPFKFIYCIRQNLKPIHE